MSVPLFKVQLTKTVMEETDLQLMDSAVNRHEQNHRLFLTTFRYHLACRDRTDVITDITDHIARLSLLQSGARRVIVRRVTRDSIHTPAILKRTVPTQWVAGDLGLSLRQALRGHPDRGDWCWWKRKHTNKLDLKSDNVGWLFLLRELKNT